MENAARNFIVAAQNSLLPGLALRLIGGLWPVLLLSANLHSRGSAATSFGALGLAFIGAAFVLVFGAWLIGHIANRRVRAPAADTAMTWPRNGFDAWGDLPDEGLKPPISMRRLVTVLGSAPIWDRVLALLLFALLAVSLAVLFFPEWVQRQVPGMALADIRALMVPVWLAVIIPMSVRRWACDSLRRLGPAT